MPSKQSKGLFFDAIENKYIFEYNSTGDRTQNKKNHGNHSRQCLLPTIIPTTTFQNHPFHTQYRTTKINTIALYSKSSHECFFKKLFQIIAPIKKRTRSSKSPKRLNTPFSSHDARSLFSTRREVARVSAAVVAGRDLSSAFIVSCWRWKRCMADGLFNNKLNQLYPLDSISLRQLLKDCSFGRLLSGLLQMK